MYTYICMLSYYTLLYYVYYTLYTLYFILFCYMIYTLGIARDADSIHIKKAYKKLALKFHPVRMYYSKLILT